MSRKPQSPEQLGYLLNDIAATADAVRTLALNMDPTEDHRFQLALSTAISALSERMGWAADMAAGRLTGLTTQIIGDDEQWMMPPAYHRASSRGV